MSRFLILPLALLALRVAAQTSTDCNPLSANCPDDPALGTTFSDAYNKSVSEFDINFWNVTAGTQLISFDDQDGAAMAIDKEGDSVTVKSNFYIFWGTVEIMMKAAPGTGIISTVILLSDDLDEVDWEVMGGNSSTVENNYYGWGNTTQINSQYPALDGAQDDFHNYTIVWSQEKIQWMLNGNVVREQGYLEPGLYPQTPCRIQFGLWCGGCSENEGTRQWAGGKADFKGAPYVMNVKSIKITDGTTNSSSYSYGDHSGHWSSIQIKEGQSEAYKRINKLSTAQMAEKHWQGLSTDAKIGIAVGVLGGVLVAVIAWIFFCISQRKKGRAEAAAHDQAWEQQNAELMEYKSMMAQGNFAVSRQSIMMEAKQDRPKSFLRGGKF
ncbi:putative extracellular glycosidase [Fulvia fulva]|uniref:chitinase n=1 Tax=Passalora fulva TaxID=5499 RepID=A0A9Q8PJ68_PASFU|nr:putative extracellular glycosidase [Fulvia fulva]KAK4611840.1 putative extracellular glycosidase [Fulvia fulva]UJO23448.1 putative extracellular glycosidase [Fulvia fulva]WPV21001.1 putative extracellular glycosidase [Fulvia fulva]WPV35762.1 putative extracellular glycosidase [Fulvia fulva]